MSKGKRNFIIGALLGLLVLLAADLVRPSADGNDGFGPCQNTALSVAIEKGLLEKSGYYQAVPIPVPKEGFFRDWFKQDMCPSGTHRHDYQALDSKGNAVVVRTCHDVPKNSVRVFQVQY